jgi:hypothetical protein
MRRATFFTRALAGLAAFATSASVSSIEAQSPHSRTGDVVIVRPTRRSLDTPALAVPDLPAAVDRVTPLAFDVVIRRESLDGRSTSIRQTVTRTASGVHMEIGDGAEWLFERNVVDGRRVAGTRVVHADRTIVVYEESALRNWLGVNGWADVLMLGLAVESLSTLIPSRHARTQGGVRFVKHVATDGHTRIVEAWWSEDQALPSGFTLRDAAGTTIVSIERLRTGIDARLLEAPAVRFPAYRVRDLAEWLEGH